MKNKLPILLLFAFITNAVFCQKLPYVIYNSKGRKVSYEKMVKSLSKKDIILFGELHNNPIAHWLQYEVASDLHGLRQLILGAEMLETDNQGELNNYLEGKINYEQLDSSARLWPNYKTDYAPLVDFAKEKQLPFIATNIPRRYAKLVFRNGFQALDSLSDKEKELIAPIPIPFDSELATYKNILEMAGGHGSPKLVMAQAVKDATMASFILKNHKKGRLFLHFNGAYHSDYHEGIGWYLKKTNNDLNFTTISTVLQHNVNKLAENNLFRADYIICVDINMTTTY